MTNYHYSLGGFYTSSIQQQVISGGFVKDLSKKLQLTRKEHNLIPTSKPYALILMYITG